MAGGFPCGSSAGRAGAGAAPSGTWVRVIWDSSGVSVIGASGTVAGRESPSSGRVSGCRGGSSPAGGNPSGGGGVMAYLLGLTVLRWGLLDHARERKRNDYRIL